MISMRLNMLGGFEASFDEETAPKFRTRKSKALLSFLAWPRRKLHYRDKLAALLWPNEADQQARKNLRQAISILRRALSESDVQIVSEGDVIYLDTKQLHVDAWEFTDRIGANVATEDLEQAIALYQGPFLDGFHLDCRPFEEWVESERSLLEERALRAMMRLLDRYVSAKKYHEGIELSHQLLKVDRLQEDVHARLMELYMLVGRRGAAAQQYRYCKKILDEELGISPSYNMETINNCIHGRDNFVANKIIYSSINKDKYEIWIPFTKTKYLDAYELSIRGRNLLVNANRIDLRKSINCFKEAIEIDSTYAYAYSQLAFGYLIEYINDWGDSETESLTNAIDLSEKSVRLDETNPFARSVLGTVILWQKEHDFALKELRTAIELAPDLAFNHVRYGWAKHFCGMSKEAIISINRGVSLDPASPDFYLHVLAASQFQLENYETSRKLLKRRIIRKPDTDISRVLLASTCGHLGLKHGAEMSWRDALRINPDYSLEASQTHFAF